MKKVSILVFCVLLCLGFMPGCQSSQSPVSKVDSDVSDTSADEYAGLWDRIDGSTATIPLTEGIMKHWLGLSDEEAAQQVSHSKTYNAFWKLIEGDADLVFVTSPLEEWLNAGRQQDVEVEVIPVVKDALVFLANRKNEVNSLTQQQLKSIYTGEVTNWSSLGGADAAIKPFQRPQTSGSQALFLQLLMKDTEPAQAVPGLEVMSMGGLIDSVAAYDNAESSIGYSVFYYAADMYRNNEVKLIGVDGVAPSRDTIADGSYPLITYYYAVVRKDTPETDPARLESDGGKRRWRRSADWNGAARHSQPGGAGGCL